MNAFLRRFLYYYPLTFAGSVLLVASLLLLGKGLANRNPYALLLSVLALAALILLAAGSRLQAIRFASGQVQWDSSGELIARREGLAQTIHSEPETLIFFRLHFRLRGRMAVGRRAWLHLWLECSTNGGGSHSFPIYFPLCGTARAWGRFQLRDVFGLSRARFGSDQERELVVQPASYQGRRTPLPEAAEGLEDQSRKKSSDEERYFMRDYIPGDRFRDINWKVSSRLNELFTRISPVTQEKSKIIYIELRNFRRPGKESLESILHLNHIKSWLLSFLRETKKEKPEYQFQVRSGSGTELLESEEDIDRFARELSGIFYETASTPPEPGSGERELFVYSTPYDTGLPLLLSSMPQTRIHVHRTLPAVDGMASNGEESVKRRGGIRGGKRSISLFRLPLTPMFPGSWAWRRDRDLTAPTVGDRGGGRLEEEQLEVSLF